MNACHAMSFFTDALVFFGSVLAAAGLAIYAVEVWHRECQRRQQRRLRDSVEDKGRP
jgi:hypothetical protein